VSKLVGYSDGVWSGGAFESTHDTPQEVAAEHYAEASRGFPSGPDAITHALVTDFQALRGWRLRRTGDGTTPEGWTVEGGS
jgi:hypothetical protein